MADSFYSELTVTIKSDDGTYKQKFPMYDAYQVTPEDPLVKQCIDEAIANTKIIPDTVKLKISMEV